VPTPTKAIWQTNSNSSLGNQKGHYDVVFNTLPRTELVVYNDWWWTGSCEYSDIVYGVDSWVEFKQPDMTGSNTNPFVQVFPATPLPRVFRTVSDNETYLGVGRELTRITGDQRFEQMWHHVCRERHGGVSPAHHRRHRDAARLSLHPAPRDGAAGIPALQNTRTYPRVNSYDQIHDSRPWYTRTGRLEFYRPEPEFIEAGENLLTYREPSDSTFHEPCVIVAEPHPALRPKLPADWNIAPDDRGAAGPPDAQHHAAGDEVLATEHPVMARGYRPHLPHPEVPPRRAHHAHRHRLHDGAVRALRRHLPPRPAHARHGRDVRRHQPARRASARHRRRRLRVDRRRPIGAAVPRLAGSGPRGGVQGRTADGAGALLPRHAERHHAHVVQRLHGHPRLGRATRRAPTASPRIPRPTTRRCSATAATRA
jgi:hypothetical protein